MECLERLERSTHQPTSSKKMTKGRVKRDSEIDKVVYSQETNRTIIETWDERKIQREMCSN